MFSLAVVLYEMLAGKRPFTGETSGQVLHKLVSADPEPLSLIRPDLPDATGEWFGEQPFIHGHAEPRQATVETTVGSVFVEFPLGKLESLSERCQRRFVKALLRTLADRLALSNERIARMG